MQGTEIHDGKFLKILWDGEARIIGIDWKETTAAMTDGDFKTDLLLFAGHVEARQAQGILVDVAHFRHKMGQGVEGWRLKNISPRYSAAGVRRFAFLLPKEASVPPMMNQSAPEEGFQTRVFQDVKEAMRWLTAAGWEQTLDDEIRPFKVEVPQAALEDLRQRLGMTRWPERETASDWSQGVPLDKMQVLVSYWTQAYDWRAAEARLNAFPQFRTQIDGLGIHFLHVRSKHENALPIILTHGWPGSVFEFLKVIGPLVDPTAHGGKVEDAFHVVVPSLPGYGFSDKPSQPGWGLPRIAKAWAELMKRLGYTRWVAQGGDWGAGVATWLAKQHADGLVGVHLNFPTLFPPPIEGEPNAEEQASIAQLIAFDTRKSGYAKLLGTRPQTAGYGLQDSPVGLAAWIYEKIAEWTASNWQPETVLTRDEILDDITLYWLTGTATSSSRLYAESFATDNDDTEARYPGSR